MTEPARNPWLGIDCRTDRVELARSIARRHARYVVGGDLGDAGLRPVISASWERARLAGLNPERHVAPRVLDDEGVEDRWARHPLQPFAPMLERLLADFAHDARQIVVVADADGCLLWSSGSRGVLGAADAIGFVPGRRWDEETTGTNGVGTALATGHPVQVFSAEHFARDVHPWVCCGAPVLHPETRRVLGVIDVSCGIRAAHPDGLALAVTTAQMIEAVLRAELGERRERARARFFERLQHRSGSSCALVDDTGRVLASHPRGWLGGPLVRGDRDAWMVPGATGVLEGEPFGDGTSIVSGEVAPSELPALRIEALGRSSARVGLRGATVELSPRHSEILVLLALSEEGLTANEIAQDLYGSTDRRMTVRAEISRLRRRLPGVIATQPYRLLAEVDGDFLRRSHPHPRPPHVPSPGLLLPEATSARIRAARRRLRDLTAVA